LIEFKPDHNKTNIGEALRYLINVVKKRSIVFLISDFMDEGYERALKIANRKHDLVALRIYDPREQELPSMGLVPFRDAETDELRWVNTSSHTVRRNYKARALEQQAYMKDLFRRSGVDHASIATTESYIKPLMNLFKRRG